MNERQSEGARLRSDGRLNADERCGRGMLPFRRASAQEFFPTTSIPTKWPSGLARRYARRAMKLPTLQSAAILIFAPLPAVRRGATTEDSLCSWIALAVAHPNRATKIIPPIFRERGALNAQQYVARN